MKRRKKTLALILGVLMIAALVAACGPAATTPAAPAQGGGAPAQGGGQAPVRPDLPAGDGGITATIEDDAGVTFADHVSITMENVFVAALNPFVLGTNNSSTNQAFIMIYDRLLERNHDTGEFVASLATQWNTEDYQTFTFTLRDDVRFHNGDRFTAQDVVDTIIMSRESPGTPGAANWNLVAEATAINDTTLEIVLSRVNVDFYHSVAHPASGILNRRAIEADPEAGSRIGTGAFIVTEFVANDFVRYARNHDWWNDVENGGRMNIRTETILNRFIPEIATRTVMMQTGESHLGLGVSSEDVELFINNPDNFQVVSQLFNSPLALSFNMNDPIVSDFYFRRAVMHALDKYDISLFAAGVWGEPEYISGTVWGYATEFRNNDIPVIRHDPAMAMEYLEKSSYNGEEVEIAAGMATHLKAAQAIQQQLQSVGINVRLAEFDGPGLTAHVFAENSRSQLVFINFIIDFSAGSVRHLFYPGGAQNRMHYNNPEVTGMLDEAAAMTDTNARREHFMKIQEIVFEDAPFFNMYHRVNPVVAVNGLGGVGLTAENRQIDLREMFQVIS